MELGKDGMEWERKGLETTATKSPQEKMVEILLRAVLSRFRREGCGAAARDSIDMLCNLSGTEGHGRRCGLHLRDLYRTDATYQHASASASASAFCVR